MGFAVEKQDGVTVVDVEGQLIVGNRQELKQTVLDELEAGERKFVLKALLSQEPAATLGWLARECRTWAVRHHDNAGLLGTAASFWIERAEISSALLNELSEEAGEPVA